jgi:phosphopantetheinyl transferase
MKPTTDAILNQPGDIAVWTACPNDFDDAKFEVMSAMLDPTERAKSNRFKHAADRSAYVLAHAMRRVALACALRVAPADLLFTSDAQGKPLLTVLHAPRSPDIYFSHSHSRALVACAVTRTGPVGIDVACTQDGSADLDLLAGLVDLPDAQQRKAELGVDPMYQFFFYWTALEAFWKAEGCGLASANPPIRCLKNPNGQFEVFLASSAVAKARITTLNAPAGCWITLACAYTSNRTIEVNAAVKYNFLMIPLPTGEGSVE